MSLITVWPRFFSKETLSEKASCLSIKDTKDQIRLHTKYLPFYCEIKFKFCKICHSKINSFHVVQWISHNLRNKWCEPFNNYRMEIHGDCGKTWKSNISNIFKYIICYFISEITN